MDMPSSREPRYVRGADILFEGKTWDNKGIDCSFPRSSAFKDRAGCHQRYCFRLSKLLLLSEEICEGYSGSCQAT